jgi:hypothetical protein
MTPSTTSGTTLAPAGENVQPATRLPTLSLLICASGE